MKTITVQLDDTTYELFRSLRSMLAQVGVDPVGVLTDAQVITALILAAYAQTYATRHAPEGVL